MSLENPVNIKRAVIRDGDDVDWVTHRRRCGGDGQGAFDAIKERVAMDVARANEVLDQTPLEVMQPEDWDGNFQVVKAKAPDRIESVNFTLQHDGLTKIEIRTGNNLRPSIFKVAHQWDEATASCRLIVDGVDVQLWQISELALVPLVFPSQN